MTETSFVEQLSELERIAAVCTDCRLCESRTQVVFGDGSPTADIMFIGEGPGYHEDQQGIPFVGAAGQLLNRLLDEVGLAREQCYIANVVKCRPPGNRDPRQDEIDACKHYLADQIRLIDPKVVVTLGNFSSKLLLKEDSGISRLRGRPFNWWNRIVVPTYHPAAALRGGAGTLDAIREDLALVISIAERPAEVEAEPEQLGLFG
ncbi:MAG: uracil-DNA glycosylase [Acidimicrobiia bacterium]